MSALFCERVGLITGVHSYGWGSAASVGHSVRVGLRPFRAAAKQRAHLLPQLDVLVGQHAAGRLRQNRRRPRAAVLQISLQERLLLCAAAPMHYSSNTPTSSTRDKWDFMTALSSAQTP